MLQNADSAVGVSKDSERLYLVQKKNNDFVGNGHMSRAGNAVVARALVDSLISNKLAPRWSRENIDVCDVTIAW
jgi:hypothetical protein